MKVFLLTQDTVVKTDLNEVSIVGDQIYVGLGEIKFNTNWIY